MICPDCFYPGKAHAGGCPGESVPDPVECKGCQCADEDDIGAPCVWYEAGSREGGDDGLHAFFADGKLVPCRQCEGSGEYVPEIEEDVPEPDEDDWMMDR